MGAAAFHAGFGRASMWGQFTTDKMLADDLDVRALAVRGDGQPFIIAVADLDLSSPTLRVRKAKQ